MYLSTFKAFVVVLASYYAVRKLDTTITPEYCMNATSSPPVVWTAKWVGICPQDTTVHIPKVLISSEMQTLRRVAQKFPGTTDIEENRIAMGMISMSLAAIKTPESHLMMNAVSEYEQQAMKTVQSLAKLEHRSLSIRDAVAGIVNNIMKALHEFPRHEKHVGVVVHAIRSQQRFIDYWVMGLQETLKVFHAQATETLANLDACDVSISKISRTSGVTYSQQGKMADETNSLLWTIFGGEKHLYPEAVEAVKKLESLIYETNDARNVVGKLVRMVSQLIAGIEDAKKYSDQVLTVEMALEKDVKRAVGELLMVLEAA